MTIEDGGYAFPVAFEEDNGYGVRFLTVNQGMTLRDWFAANAPITRANAIDHAYMYKCAKGTIVTEAEIMEILADLRYAYADAMINRRKS